MHFCASDVNKIFKNISLIWSRKYESKFDHWIPLIVSAIFLSLVYSKTLSLMKFPLLSLILFIIVA